MSFRRRRNSPGLEGKGDEKILPIIISILSINSTIQGALALQALDGNKRYVGTFTDPNYFATFQSVVLVILLVIFLDNGLSKIKRFLLTILITLTTISIVISFSRGAYLQIVISIFIFLLIRYKKNILKLGLFVFGFLSLLYSLVLLINKYFSES